MNKKNNVKNVFFYNIFFHKQSNQRQKYNLRKKCILNVLILIFLIISCIIDVNYKPVTTITIVIFFVLCGLILTLFLVFLYNLLLLIIINFDESLFSDRCYIITNDEKLYTIKFCYSLINKNIDSDDLAKIIEYFIIDNKNECKYIKLDEKINIDEIVECTNFFNIRNIKEEEDFIEFTSDSNDLKNKCSFENKTYKIYKYYNNWNQILVYLQGKISKKLEKSNYKSGEYNNFVSAIYKFSSNSYDLFFLILILYFMKNINVTTCVVFGIIIMFYLLILYLKKVALEHLDDKPMQKFYLIKTIKKDSIFIIIYFIIFIILGIKFISQSIKIFIILMIISLFLILIANKIVKKR